MLQNNKQSVNVKALVINDQDLEGGLILQGFVNDAMYISYWDQFTVLGRLLLNRVVNLFLLKVHILNLVYHHGGFPVEYQF